MIQEERELSPKTKFEQLPQSELEGNMPSPNPIVFEEASAIAEALQSIEEPSDANTTEMPTDDESKPEETLRAVTNKRGQTQFMISGVNADTGATYNRFASKDEVQAALGDFTAKESTPDKHELDATLRQSVAYYRKNKANLSETELDEARNKIFNTFEQLKVADAWNGDETARRQGDLFRYMDGELESQDYFALPNESREDTMNRAIEMLAPTQPVQEEDAVEDAAKLQAQNDVLTTAEKGMWDEMESRNKMRFPRLKKLARFVMSKFEAVPLPPEQSTELQEFNAVDTDLPEGAEANVVRIRAKRAGNTSNTQNSQRAA